MALTPRDRLVRLLAGDQAVGSGSAMLRLPSDAVELHVTDVGGITLPVRAAQAKRLISAARPAMFGRGQETLSDRSVRDTWELTPAQVTLGGPQWNAHLETALTHFRDELGLPPGSHLRAEVHSLLVYGKGQFFLPHQDSEKHDEMVATLVVSLPSVHTGGELVVDDGGTERTYRGSRDDVVLVAFYADRRHEVRPVRSGYRVTLTFNIMLTSGPFTSEAGPVEQTATHLTEHFTSPATSRYGDRDLGVPTRLTFLLDHEYSQKGLAAQRFKGADAERVRLLRAAAELAGCETVLALAEIKETWDAIPAGESWAGGWYDDEVEDPDDDPGDGAYDLNELIDDEITLGWWIAPDGSGEETISLPLGHQEVCAVTPSRSLTPYHSEYEGYMGNYGNTVDRWYRRAAMVVWPKEKSFAARAEAGSTWALRTLLNRIDAGDLETARADAVSLEPFWLHIEAHALAPALHVAGGLRDPVAARVVLAPFRLEMLTSEHAPLLAAVARVYGDQWVQGLIDRWDSGQRFGLERTSWVGNTLSAVCQALRASEAAPLADHVVDRVWRWLSSGIDTLVHQNHPERRRSSLADLGQPLTSVLESVSDERGASIAETLRAADDNVVEVLVPALRAHRPPSTNTLIAVVLDCRDRLTRLVDGPARARDDWSIEWTGCGCGCGECSRLETFLSTRSERTHEWPLAKPGRQHVHRQIDDAGLPVRHTTRRQGRPFTLILEKTDALFQQERDSRRQAQRDLEWLACTFDQGA